MSLARYRTALLVVLLVVGLGAAAATLESGTFSTAGPGESPSVTGDGGSAPPVVVYLYTFVVLSVVLAALAVAVGIFFEGTSVRGLAAVGVGFALVAVVVLAAIDVQSALQSPPQTDGVDPAEIADSLLEGGTDSASPDSSGDGGSGGIASPVLVLAALGGLVVAGLVGFAYFSRGSSDDVEPVTTDRGDEPTAAVGQAAGRAADRVGEADLSNAIYGAWRDMTDALDVDDPATTTPAEFADSAVAAGLDEDDVGELTRLFQAVRYGSAPVTPERERRAAETLRRIEAAYADPNEDGGGDT